MDASVRAVLARALKSLMQVADSSGGTRSAAARSVPNRASTASSDTESSSLICTGCDAFGPNAPFRAAPTPPASASCAISRLSAAGTGTCCPGARAPRSPGGGAAVAPGARAAGPAGPTADEADAATGSGGGG